MKGFSDLQFRTHPHGMGVQALMDFPNGYGVSVVRGPYTYGGDEGLWELAVMHAGHLCYDSGITEDVEGHLTEDEVTNKMHDIQNLQARTERKLDTPQDSSPSTQSPAASA